MRTVLVTGSRSWPERLGREVRHRLDGFNPDLIIHGGAEGVDTFALEWCRRNGRDARVCYPNYAKYGKAAPLRRNDRMVKLLATGLYGDAYVLAFPFGEASGTRYTIRKAKAAGFRVTVLEGVGL